MAEARKLITTTHKGEHEIQTWHVTYFDMDLKKLEEVWEDESDDYESAYYNGMGGDMDGDLYFIEVDNFLRFCSNLSEGFDEDEPNYKKENYKHFYETLMAFKGYTIYPNRNKPNDTISEEGE